MKKLIRRITGAACAAAVLAGGTVLLPVHAAEVQRARIMGDLTGDCKVTMEDAKKALDIAVAGRIGLTDRNANGENNPADIDMNGMIETMDALAILRYFCQSLVGEQPLWSEIRKITYVDGTECAPKIDQETGEYVHLPFEKRGMYLEIGCAEGKPGEEVTVPVYLAGIDSIAGFQYYQMAPACLKLTEITSELGVSQRYEQDENGESRITILDENAEYVGAVNLFSGAFVWVAPGCDNMSLTDGIILANYTYKIPEDAKDGEHYVLSLDTMRTLFGTCDGNYDFQSYQYTLLDGVIVVKE